MEFATAIQSLMLVVTLAIAIASGYSATDTDNKKSPAAEDGAIGARIAESASRWSLVLPLAPMGRAA